MSPDEFWKINDDSLPQSGSVTEHVENMITTVALLPAEEIIAFERNRRLLMARAYRADLWDVISIVDGGCSDDGFYEFRNWLILQGKETYNKVLERPESLADFDSEKTDFFNDKISTVAETAYIAKTGREFPHEMFDSVTPKLKGELLDDDALRRKYPVLWQRFCENANCDPTTTIDQ